MSAENLNLQKKGNVKNINNLDISKTIKWILESKIIIFFYTYLHTEKTDACLSMTP